MNKLLKELYDWLDEPKPMTRQLIKYKIIEINSKEASKKKRVTSVFKPPTINEIAMYCYERSNGINAEMFFDFYQSKGWIVGKVKMKDWRAAIRTWEKSSKNNNQNQNTNGTREQPLLGRQSANTVRANASGWSNVE